MNNEERITNNGWKAVMEAGGRNYAQMGGGNGARSAELRAGLNHHGRTELRAGLNCREFSVTSNSSVCALYAVRV